MAHRAKFFWKTGDRASEVSQENWYGLERAERRRIRFANKTKVHLVWCFGSPARNDLTECEPDLGGKLCGQRSLKSKQTNKNTTHHTRHTTHRAVTGIREAFWHALRFRRSLVMVSMDIRQCFDHMDIRRVVACPAATSSTEMVGDGIRDIILPSQGKGTHRRCGLDARV